MAPNIIQINTTLRTQTLTIVGTNRTDRQCHEQLLLQRRQQFETIIMIKDKTQLILVEFVFCGEFLLGQIRYIGQCNILSQILFKRAEATATNQHDCGLYPTIDLDRSSGLLKTQVDADWITIGRAALRLKGINIRKIRNLARVILLQQPTLDMFQFNLHARPQSKGNSIKGEVSMSR